MMVGTKNRLRWRLFTRYQRSEKALVLALMEMYIKGACTCRVAKIREELCGTAFSKSTVSLLSPGLDTELEAWRERSLSETAHPLPHSRRHLREGAPGGLPRLPRGAYREQYNSIRVSATSLRPRIYPRPVTGQSIGLRSGAALAPRSPLRWRRWRSG